MSSEEDNLMSQDEQEDSESNEGSDRRESGAGASSLSLTKFMFGNVDKEGRLESDFLDQDTKKHLNSLERLGCSLTSDIVPSDETTTGSSSESTSENSNDTPDQKQAPASDSKKKNEDDDDFNQKSPSAIDYSDISELADDEVLPESLPFKMPTAPLKLNLKGIKRPAADDEDDDYDTPLKDSSDKPSAAPASAASDKSDGQIDTPSTPSTAETPSHKLLDTPLAAMLPDKYKDVDVVEIFPEFRKDQVLRFSRLFGAGKPSHLPQPWKNVKFKKSLKEKGTDDQQNAENEATTSAAAGHKTDTSGDESESQDDDGEEEQDMEIDMGDQPSPSRVETDDEDVLQRPLELRNYSDEDGSEAKDSAPKVADWRFGPAQYWYDFIGVPESGEGFDYGLKQRQREGTDPGEQDDDDFAVSTDSIDPDDAFHLVTQLQWEDDIIWNGDDIKQKVLAKLNDKNHAAGWVPSGLNRTASAFTQQVKGTTTPKVPAPVAGPSGLGSKKGDKNKNEASARNTANATDEMWYSIFPVENEELIYGIWEDDIIWDAENMKKIPEPRVLTLDPNDENIVLGIPDDIDPSTVQKKEPAPIPLKEKKEHHLKKSRILLGKAGVIAEQEQEVAPPPTTIQRDPFNISNDEYYNPKLTTDTALKPNAGGNLIQHSIPALELRQPFFPTHMGLQKLRAFHRPALKRFSHGTIADTLPHSVLPLVKHIKKKQKQREAERQAAGGGEIFFMRTPEDLSGKDSDIILTEMSEEHPPLVSQVGMATKIKNYFKRKPGKDGGVPEYEYGETAYSQQSPFLGNLTPGQSLQTLENNLYRAPIFRHDVPDTDFLIIRTRNNYFVREVNTIFTVGQQLPLFEVPGPNSKKANNFIRDFLQVFIYRLFYQSKDVPKRIKMEDIKKAFPSHSESSIRKRLKLCADFKRTGMDSNWWVLKPDFRLPTEDEMRAMVSPEQCCAFYSMIAAEQRLKDAGYGERSLFAAEDDNDEDLQVKMDDEVKAAPWNTTRAFIAAMNGKCLLQLAGVADPTGCGEGFSYVRVPNKPTINKEETQKELAKEKKTVTGTDADLRRLPLNQAKQLLRKHGVPEDEIKKLSRWEVIDVVRTLSTEQAKAGTDTMSKFARGNRFSIAEHQERYKEECQRVFELQNQVLQSNEVLSTDEDESEEDSDIEEMAKNMESMLSNKKTSQQLSHEKEEAERMELQKMIMGEDSNPADDKKKKKIGDEDEDNASHVSSTGRILKIYRTYVNADKKEYVRIETVRKPAIIDTYVKIKQTKDPEFIRKFATALDDQQKEEKRREKRRIQEQLRRLKRNEEREKTGYGKKTWKDHSGVGHASTDRSFLDFDECPTRDDDSSPSKSGIGNSSSLTPEKKRKSFKEKKPKKLKEITMKCGACGEVGHMKTNRNCPMFTGGDGYLPPMNVAMTEEEQNMLEMSNVEEEGECLVKAEDTKIILSKTVMNQAEEMRRKTLVLKVPKELMKRKKRAGSDHCDYLQKPDYKATNRRRTDPLVSLSLILENLCNEMKDLPGVELFLTPVNAKLVTDYYKIISKPMDLQTMRKKVGDKLYKCRADFMTDMDQIVTNSTLYNGLNHILTTTAKGMRDLCAQRFAEKADKIARIEKAINPLLDDNDHVAFGFMMESVTEALRLVPESWPFHKPVDKKKVKDYYDRVHTPMDLETIVTLIKHNKYTTVAEYMSDVELILNNSKTYNGLQSQFTKKAEEIVEKAKSLMAENADRLRELEERIAATKEAALEAADSESVVTGGSVVGDRDEFSRPGSSAAHSYHSDEDEEEDYSNAYEYEESRLLGRRDDDADSPEDQSSMGAPAAPAAGVEEEDVDQNYDPEEFLLESFHVAATPAPAIPAPVDQDETAQPEWQTEPDHEQDSAAADEMEVDQGQPFAAANDDERAQGLDDPQPETHQAAADDDGDDEGLWF